ncbi:MAG: hypothetical protein BZY87_02840 [SAR202 cluster bacterium Io17-Chloro-G6]|nr:MAG: hypothetical protein BZY87_02840 [SAR202 cluster bacterium Io17-Chloro-G6]
MLRVEDVANYFLANQDSGHGEPISHLKIQKLCYYAQGISLAILERPLFFEDIEHWTHGPVVPTLYRKYRSFGADPITRPENLNLTIYSRETIDLLDKVYQLYGQDSAWELRNKTHEESPWRNTPDRCAITHQELRAYFQTLGPLYEDFGDIDREVLRKLPEIPQVMKDLKRGIEAYRTGKMVAWDEVKEEIGIE